MLECGTVLSSRYQIESVLGRGGMGSVYLASMNALGDKRVAVKEMELRGVESVHLDRAVDQFAKEAAFLANLEHPNLVPVTDFFSEGNKHYLVMTYIQGESLQEKLANLGRPFRWDELRGWAKRLVEVLGYLHAQDPPILFRDLKPSNVMIADCGRLHLIDFGIARTAQAGDRTTTFLQGVGTSGFSPIEQYGSGQSTDQRSDIYSLGATLYYLLTGQVPADAVSRVSGDEVLIPASHHTPSVSPALDRLLSRALATHRRDRHQNVEEFAKEMAALEDDTWRPELPTEVLPKSSRPKISIELVPTTKESQATPVASWLSLLAVSCLALAFLAVGSPRPPAVESSASPQPTLAVSESLARSDRPAEREKPEPSSYPDYPPERSVDVRPQAIEVAVEPTRSKTAPKRAKTAKRRPTVIIPTAYPKAPSPRSAQQSPESPPLALSEPQRQLPQPEKQLPTPVAPTAMVGSQPPPSQIGVVPPGQSYPTAPTYSGGPSFGTEPTTVSSTGEAATTTTTATGQPPASPGGSSQAPAPSVSQAVPSSGAEVGSVAAPATDFGQGAPPPPPPGGGELGQGPPPPGGQVAPPPPRGGGGPGGPGGGGPGGGRR